MPAAIVLSREGDCLEGVLAGERVGVVLPLGCLVLSLFDMTMGLCQFRGSLLWEGAGGIAGIGILLCKHVCGGCREVPGPFANIGRGPAIHIFVFILRWFLFYFIGI